MPWSGGLHLLPGTYVAHTWRGLEPWVQGLGYRQAYLGREASAFSQASSAHPRAALQARGQHNVGVGPRAPDQVPPVQG